MTSDRIPSVIKHSYGILKFYGVAGKNAKLPVVITMNSMLLNT